MKITFFFSVKTQNGLDYLIKFEILLKVKCKVQNKFKGRKMYKAIEYESAVVAGTNYRIKVKIFTKSNKFYRF